MDIRAVARSQDKARRLIMLAVMVRWLETVGARRLSSGKGFRVRG